MSAPKTYTLLGADGRPYQSASKGQLTAIAAGYRPCATCCPGRYQQWKNGPWRRDP